jgi:hypothetical protein
MWRSYIDATNDTITVANGTTGDDTAGNVLADNGNGTDTLNGSPVTIGLVTLTITTPATAINGGIPTINPTTGTVVVPKYACRKLYYCIPNCGIT